MDTRLLAKNLIAEPPGQEVKIKFSEQNKFRSLVFSLKKG